ncbi:MAG: hypothetical protein MI754_06305 [Chromatiales bacterium]|nr:hypothetical protein [Chromatiales bacterium]
MSRLIVILMLLSATGCSLAQPKQSQPEPTQQQIIQLLLDAGQTDLSAIPSCEHAAYPQARTLSEYMSHYLSILAQEARIKITLDNQPNGDQGGEANLLFSVDDPEAPWEYGFRFNYRHQPQGYSVDTTTLTCVGAG